MPRRYINWTLVWQSTLMDQSSNQKTNMGIVIHDYTAQPIEPCWETNSVVQAQVLGPRNGMAEAKMVCFKGY